LNLCIIKDLKMRMSLVNFREYKQNLHQEVLNIMTLSNELHMSKLMKTKYNFWRHRRASRGGIEGQYA